MSKKIDEQYKGFSIIAEEKLFENEHGKSVKNVHWVIMKRGKLVLTDSFTIDGDRLQDVSHAVNQAKKTVDTIYRLLNDKKKYNRWVKRNPDKYKRRMCAHWNYHKTLYNKMMGKTV